VLRKLEEKYGESTAAEFKAGIDFESNGIDDASSPSYPIRTDYK